MPHGIYETFTVDDVLNLGYDSSEGRPTAKELDGADVVYCSYDTGDYCGGWLVVFIKDGTWYIDSGSHCSCNGPGWNPERVSDPESLLGSTYTLADNERFHQCVRAWL